VGADGPLGGCPKPSLSQPSDPRCIRVSVADTPGIALIVGITAVALIITIVGTLRFAVWSSRRVPIAVTVAGSLVVGLLLFSSGWLLWLPAEMFGFVRRVAHRRS